MPYQFHSPVIYKGMPHQIVDFQNKVKYKLKLTENHLDALKNYDKSIMPVEIGQYLPEYLKEKYDDFVTFEEFPLFHISCRSKQM